jgi:hypothetical protein
MNLVFLFYTGGRSKPVPPPRSHSLESFGKKFEDFETRDIDIEDKHEEDEHEEEAKASSSEAPSSQIYETFGNFFSSIIIFAKKYSLLLSKLGCFVFPEMK